ncbi:hypothetical protein TRFO_18941 [Tritrichomonas foetus]|uniref:DUF3447 domain-containing protein n=1 Tax=Tritrichomonas foetus TaxID=1144522 RepID=A0A1J4KJU2_9EUKA|nr:hypothetical protein TRFO_18941 [Tritrichomonas foetus]|eukprot:OHT11575.1 hypothetical protein TRFO_18941 [Tritrichomonas foetus]
MLYIIHKTQFVHHMDIEILRSSIIILANLQRKLLALYECDETKINIKLHELSNYLTNEDVKGNLALYDAFIRMVSYTSLIRPSNSTIFTKITSLIDDLYEKHCLNELFYPATIFELFRNNKRLILYLLEKQHIDITLITNEIHSRYNMDYFVYFLPEIKKFNFSIYKQLKTEFRSDLKYYKLKNIIKKPNRKELYKNRDGDNIRKIIQNDDLDSFLKIIASNETFNLNSKIRMLFESNEILIKDYEGITLLDCSIFYGSINIFKYLRLNKADYSSQSLLFSIVGGNIEILHILEEETQPNFSDYHLFQAVKYHQLDIMDYIMSSNSFDASNYRQDFIKLELSSYNFEKISEFLTIYSNQPSFIDNFLSNLFPYPKLYLINEFLLKYTAAINQQNGNILFPVHGVFTISL